MITEEAAAQVTRYTIPAKHKEQVKARIQPWAALSDEAFAERKAEWRIELATLIQQGLLIKEVIQ